MSQGGEDFRSLFFSSSELYIRFDSCKQRKTKKLEGVVRFTATLCWRCNLSLLSRCGNGEGEQTVCSKLASRAPAQPGHQATSQEPQFAHERRGMSWVSDDKGMVSSPLSQCLESHSSEAQAFLQGQVQQSTWV